MGKVLKYVGWSFVAILVLVLGTIGVLAITGAFSDDQIYLDSITLDVSSLLNNIDQNDTTLSNYNDTLVAINDFSISTAFSPAEATAKTLNIKVLKGADVVSVPKTVVAGEPINVKILKEKKVYTDNGLFYIINDALYDSSYQLVDQATTPYEIISQYNIIVINGTPYSYIESNIGGEVKLQATDSEGGATYAQVDFFVDTEIKGLDFDFSGLGVYFDETTGDLLFNEDTKARTFTLKTDPANSINPSTGEVYSNLFNFKTVDYESSDDSVIKIIKKEHLASTNSNGDIDRSVRFTIDLLKAGTTKITAKALPTYQMRVDWEYADEKFRTDTTDGPIIASDFATKYAEYLKRAGNIIVNEDGSKTTEGAQLYFELVNSTGRVVINNEFDYKRVMNLLFIKVEKEIEVVNVEITDFSVATDSINLDLFDTIAYNRNQLIDAWDIKLESPANLSQAALNTRLDALKMYSVKAYKTYDALEDITDEDREVLFTTTKIINGTAQQVIYYTPISSNGTTKYYTYIRNDSVLGVFNPTSTDSTWRIRANKEQVQENDGTAVILELYDEVSGTYFYDSVTVKIKVTNINVFDINTNLITDMSLSDVNNHGKPNLIYVDLRFENIGKTGSLITDFTMDASYTNIKLFVTAASARLDGVLKIRVKTKDGTENGEPMTYTMPYNDTTLDVYEIDYKHDSSGRICIQALNTSIKYTLDSDSNPTSYIRNNIVLYVGVVRTNVNGVPVDKDGNLVDDKFEKESSGGEGWEYKNQYDFIKVANETMQFNIYSYLQGVQFYTANEDGASGFVNRTTVDGQNKEPVKMVVGQRFELYVTNLTLDSAGAFTGSPNELTNLNTAFFEFCENNLMGTNKNARFVTNNPAAEVQTAITQIKGMLKIVIECKDSTSSVDVYIAMDEAGNNFLETCTVNLQLSYATIAKQEEDPTKNAVYAYYTEGATDNKVINNNDKLIVKGFLDGSRLMWQTFDNNLNQGLGEFKFGGVDQKSLDYNINLNLDASYEEKAEVISEDIKENALYIWSSSNTDYVEVVDRVDGAGYNPVLNVYKGEPEGIDITISCRVYMYSAANGSFETKYNETYFTFRFVINITQSPIDISGYSKNENKEDGEFYWEENKGTTSSQKIAGGTSFDILQTTTAKVDSVSPEVERKPIEATIDGLDIRDSLTFTITTFSSSDNPNSYAPIYFLTSSGEITYTIDAGSLSVVDGEISLIVYAKDTLRSVNAGIIISTFHTGYESFIYYVTVTPNLTEEKSLPTGETYIKSVRGVGQTVYTFGEVGKSLDDYYAIEYEDGTKVPMSYEVVSNSAYGSINVQSGKSYFVPTRLAPTQNQVYPMVTVQVKYTILLPGDIEETYIYDEINIQVLPYYNSVAYNTNEFNIKSGDTANIFEINEYDADDQDYTGNKFFALTSNYGTGEIDDLKDIFVIQIDDSEEKLKTVLGNAEYNTLRANGFYLVNGQLKTNEALTSDELIKIKLYFIEAEGRQVLIGGDDENLLYIKVNNTVTYSTVYTETTPYEVNKNYSVEYSAATSSINVAYLNTIVSIYNSENSVGNKVVLEGGNGVDVFNKIIDTAILQRKIGSTYSSYSGTGVTLNVTKTNEFISNVSISYNDSVNEDEHYRIVFMSINDVVYEFHFVLKPNVTITKFYPIYTDYEIVESGTYLSMETNYIKQSNRVELSFGGVVLNARKVSNTSTSLTLSAPKSKLIESGLIDGIDSALVALLPSDVLITINGVTNMFTYSIVSGASNVDAGTMQDSYIMFNIAEGTAGGYTEVKVTAFNGASTTYVFNVKNKPARYSVAVSSGNAAKVYANNQFNLDDFISTCKIDGTAPDFTALRIIIVDFNGTTLNVETTPGNFAVLNIYDLINYNAVLKFKDVAEEKIVTFKMYTTASIEGDRVVELNLKVLPNVIVSNHVNNPSIPAGLDITLANTSTSPLTITKGDADLTPITTGVTYELVDENGNAFNYDGKITISSGTIKHTNIAEDRKEVWLRVSVALDGCEYSQIVKIIFVPNVKVRFDYLESGVTYKELMAAPITYAGDTLINTKSLELWDFSRNSNTYPISITDFYGNSLAADNTDPAKPTIRFEKELSGDVIVEVTPETGMMMYTATNASNVLAKVKVLISWGSVTVAKSYNIHFQPYIASTNGVNVTYTVKTGSNINDKNGYMSVFGGSEIVVQNFNTNNATAISPDTSNNALFMQAFSTTINNTATRITYSVAVNALSPEYTPIISYVRFNLGAHELYEIVNDGGIKIRFKAVSSETQIRIPYYLDLVNINGGGAYSELANASYYRPNVNGELVINLLPVINYVNTSYNKTVPYEVIIRNNNTNYVDLYSLLNVTLKTETSFDVADAANKVIINKDRVAELITLAVSQNYAYKSGKTIVFNISNEFGSEFDIEFTVAGLADKVVPHIVYSSKATLNEGDPVKTFTYSGATYYIIETTIFNQKLEAVGTYDGAVVTLQGSTVVGGSITNLTLSDGVTNVLGIYSSDSGMVDMSELVKYEVTNYKVTIDSVLYYVDDAKKNESTNGVPYVLHTETYEKYNGLFTISGELGVSANIVIQETCPLEVIDANTSKLTFEGVQYYVVKLSGVSTLCEDMAGSLPITTISKAEYVASYSIDFEANAVIFSKNYPITSETVQLSKGGLTYVTGNVGDNSTYLQDNNLLELIPFYGTDLVAGQKPYTFQVMASGSQEKSISFLLIPVETVWSIEYNGNSSFNVIEPVTGTIGEVVLNARYQTVSGSVEASNYYYNVVGGANIARLDSGDNTKLNVDYSKFTKPITINIVVSAYFNGKQESNTWSVTVNPIRLFIAKEVVANVDPLASGQSVTIEHATDGLVEHGSYDVATDVFSIALANAEDGEYVTIDGNEVKISDDLYLLQSKDISFNVEFKTMINGVLYAFTDIATLTLNRNTTITGLQTAFTADGSSTYTSMSGDVKTTIMNPTSLYPEAIKAVNSSDATEEYDELTLSISNFNVVISGSQHAREDITATLNSDGLIVISYEDDANGNYPTSIQASFVIIVTKAGGEVVYTSQSITCIIAA